jgi:hypothetical protein
MRQRLCNLDQISCYLDTSPLSQNSRRRHGQAAVANAEGKAAPDLPPPAIQFALKEVWERVARRFS